MKNKKPDWRQRAEYWPVAGLVWLARLLPLGLLRVFLRALAGLAYIVLSRRRRITRENLRHAFGHEMNESEIRRLARQSYTAFLLSLPELMKLRPHFLGADVRNWMRQRAPELEPLFQKARRLHDESRGCIFVTPHLGNWELLPYVSAAVGIPLVVVVRPLDNPYLEKLLYQSRYETGQLFIPKRNSLLPLQQMLTQGKSVGLLPDQSTMKGLPVPFFGRTAWTTPIPALLAIYQQRPIVVVACCRKGALDFDGFVSDPVWPQPGANEKDELLRLTTAMNAAMEAAIRKYPDQYFWMHNRWKDYPR